MPEPVTYINALHAEAALQELNKTLDTQAKAFIAATEASDTVRSGEILDDMKRTTAEIRAWTSNAALSAKPKP